MEESNQYRDEYFVTEADLSDQRSPPGTENQVIDFLLNDTFIRYAGIVYIILMVAAWVGVLRDALMSEGAGNVAEGAVLGLLVVAPFALIALVRAEFTRQRTGIPIYVNLVFVRDFIQIVFLFLVILGMYALVENLQDNLADSGILINFNFLDRTLGVGISEGPDPTSDMGIFGQIPVPDDSLLDWQPIEDTDLFAAGTSTRALLTGLINTIRVVITSLVGATILGIFVGIGLLSGNWLIRTVSTVFVEIFRNTPLLVQIFFIHFGLSLTILPEDEEDSINILDNFFINRRGISYPLITPSDTFIWFIIPLLLGLAAAFGVWRWRMRVLDKTGQPARATLWSFSTVLVFGVVGVVLAFIAGDFPLQSSLPRFVIEGTGLRARGEFKGGNRLTIEYISLALSLILYTAAFIADIVRAGIQSVPKGQIEASRAAGLSSGQTLQLVVLPQAMRLIVPPLTNQYLNLTKNSSLALVIGFVDLYRAGILVENKYGQGVAIILIIMLSYLMLSLIISAIMNLFNRSLRLKTR
jgi:general L-amino acid transport system permease protein